jgi:hypothetical protein
MRSRKRTSGTDNNDGGISIDSGPKNRFTSWYSLARWLWWLNAFERIRKRDLLIALLANTRYQIVAFYGLKTIRQIYLRNIYMLNASSFITLLTLKVNVIVLV